MLNRDSLLEGNGSSDDVDVSIEILFEDLYCKHFLRLQRVEDRVLHDRMLAEDVVQDAFIRALMKKEMFLSLAQETSGAYLTRITHNIAIDYLRKRNRTLEIGYGDTILDIPDRAEKPDVVSRDEEGYVIHTITHMKISINLKTTLVLKYIYCLTNKEMATFLHISNDAVRARLARARKQIKKHLKRES